MRQLLYLFLLLEFLTACATAPSGVEQIRHSLKNSLGEETSAASQLETLCDRGASAACALLGERLTPSRPLSVMQGATTDTKTVLSVLAAKDEKLAFFLIEGSVRGVIAPGQFKEIFPVKLSEPSYSDWRALEFQLENLKPNSTYQFWIVGDKGDLRDAREFKGLDVKRRGVRILAASCMDDGFKVEKTRAWSAVAQQDPDIMFFLGDNVYADKYIGLSRRYADPKALWHRYVETRNNLEFYKWPKLVPTLAIWDDHDFGMNDGDKTYPYIQQSKEIFRTFFPQITAPHVYTQGPGVSFSFSAFGQKFLFLDDRSFRTPNRQDVKGQSHFGQEQIEWIKEQIKGDEPWVWLVSGGQFFGGYHPFESFEGSHPKDFELFKSMLRSLKVPVMFLSGDRHIMEAMKIPKTVLNYETYEFTTSPLHARTFAEALKQNPNPYRTSGEAGVMNFLEIHLEPRREKQDVHVIGRQVEGEIIFNQKIGIIKWIKKRP